MKKSQDDTTDAAEFIRRTCGQSGFRTAVILGSGLGTVGTKVEAQGGIEIPYQDIPGMPQPKVAGHSGSLVVGTGDLAGCLFLRGRVHWYEGHALDRLLFATRLVCGLGIQNLIVTNAAGGIRSDFRPGDLMLLDGHATFLPVGETAVSGGEFTPGLRPNPLLWNPQLRSIAERLQTSLAVHQGVYAMMSGPNYETPAEVRMLRSLGVDAVGMSTVPEAVAAAQRGVAVLGISCITNVASGLSDQPLDHSEVSDTASSVEHEFSEWMLKLVAQA